MRDLESILEEAKDECQRDNCQSWNQIALLAMQKAIKEFKCDIADKIDEHEPPQKKG
jgi:hypothetical protein